jgi:predicted CXXCH cytochrome family protein
MVFVASMAMAAAGDGTPGQGIKLTRHDLSSKGLAGGFGDTAEQAGQDRVCIYCHAPHNTVKLSEAADIKYLPLWNHNVTAQVYALYSAGPEKPSDLNHNSAAADQLQGKNRPGGVSRLCLSCHDATVATNAYGQNSSSKGAGNKTISGAYVIGGNGDLSNHHPIGFNYDAVQATDDEIAPKTTQFAGIGVYVADLLWGNNMECTTCHDVHNTKNMGEKFLWISDYQSNFCLTCHLKNQ